MTPDTALAIILSLGLTLLFGGWFLCEWYERGSEDHRRIRTVFHCVKCGLLYTRPRRRAVGVCPKCGHANNRLKF